MTAGVSTGVVVAEDEVRRRLVRLADQIARRGALRSPQWRQAFLAVRRHVFVPRYLHDDAPGAFPARWRVVDGTDPDARDEWINAVYSDMTLVTDLKGEPIPAEHGGGTHPIVTSSSTLPGLMIRMLEELDVRDGMRVLEIGTGTGYHAALLCARLGADHVTSVDIDPHLVELARRRLAAHGYRPHLVAGDGELGVPDRAPYDRIIATCGVPRIPPQWLEQTRPGGKIMANLLGPLMRSALVRLTVHRDGTASGTFLPVGASFMPLRHDPAAPYDYTVRIARPDSVPVTSFTSLDPAGLHHNAAWGFLAQTCLSDAAFRLVTANGQEERLGTEMATPDGSWAIGWHTPEGGHYRVEQTGPRRLCEILELTHEQWATLGRPRWDRFGLTVTPRCHTIWLDTPDSGHHWPVG